MLFLILLLISPWYIAHLLGKMTLVRNGKLVATGVHDKVNVDAPAAGSSRVPKL